MSEKEQCPFEIGDSVVFAPNEKVKGWYPNYEEDGFFEGRGGIISRIKDGMYIYLDQNPNGLHWKCFEHSKRGTRQKSNDD